MWSEQLTTERYIKNQMLSLEKSVDRTPLRRIIRNRLTECRRINARSVVQQRRWNSRPLKTTQIPREEQTEEHVR